MRVAAELVTKLHSCGVARVRMMSLRAYVSVGVTHTTIAVVDGTPSPHVCSSHEIFLQIHPHTLEAFASFSLILDRVFVAPVK